MKTITYDPKDSEFRAVLVADKIVGLRKSLDGELTIIKLITGEEIESLDSINTLEARLNSDA